MKQVSIFATVRNSVLYYYNTINTAFSKTELDYLEILLKILSDSNGITEVVSTLFNLHITMNFKNVISINAMFYELYNSILL